MDSYETNYNYKPEYTINHFFPSRLDGKVFHPEEVPELIPDHYYTITIHPEKETCKTFMNILQRATDLGIKDMARNHDHYLYGTEK